ncbi:hypothetical protein Y032_0012g1755 [Ancylostoma ceylanicum]|uniref:Uncharacterized protein n=1 Tax=Ancylostoma ceylanicum TaxID=53326 RepID=A0A016VEM6_9BILA|nr:hypothetical protein Y032_0012g1755 [Ancylostoma ceylanicum]
MTAPPQARRVVQRCVSVISEIHRASSAPTGPRPSLPPSNQLPSCSSPPLHGRLLPSSSDMFCCVWLRFSFVMGHT